MQSISAAAPCHIHWTVGGQVLAAFTVVAWTIGSDIVPRPVIVGSNQAPVLVECGSDRGHKLAEGIDCEECR